MKNKIAKLFNNNHNTKNINIDLVNFCDLIKLFIFTSFINYKDDVLNILPNEILFLKKYMNFIDLIFETKNMEIKQEFLYLYESHA